MVTRGQVRYEILGTADRLDLTSGYGIVTTSIANLLTIVEGFTDFEPAMEAFERVLVNCWQSFCLLGDITVSIVPGIIVIHTRHEGDALHQLHIVVLTTGTVAMGIQTNGDPKTGVLKTEEDWSDFMRFLGGLRLNTTRKVRTKDME